jgi:hypothetical protein
VRAETGALALFVGAEDALAIVATTGYPLSVVEHLRIRPSDGLIGSAYKSGNAFVADCGSGPRRLRIIRNRFLHGVADHRRPGAARGHRAHRSGTGAGLMPAISSRQRVMVSTAASAFSRQGLHARLATTH